MYIVFERPLPHVEENGYTYFALTEEQMKDEGSKVCFKGDEKEIARVATVRDMKNLNTERYIMYLNKKGEVRFAK